MPPKAHAHDRTDVIPPGMNSTELVETHAPAKVEPRDWWLDHQNDVGPPWISSSDFISKEMIEHLMREKRDTAIATKSVARDRANDKNITNMEGMLHSFVIPIVLGYMHGDYYYEGGHSIKQFPTVGTTRLGRWVIISAMIHPDFEDSQVMWEFCSFRPGRRPNSALAMSQKLAPVSDGLAPRVIGTRDMMLSGEKGVTDWDEALAYSTLLNLLQLDDLDQWYENPVALHQEALFDCLKQAIESSSPRRAVRGRRFVAQGASYKSTSRELSLEVLFLVVLEQLRNEFLALERICQNTGYVYTFSPPVIFRRYLGGMGRELMLLVYAAALREFALGTQLRHMKVLAYSDFESPEAVGLLKLALRNQKVRVMSKDDLFQNMLYSPSKDVDSALLVLHNNSDAFGQNIENEQGFGSLDAVIGRFSSAAASLSRARDDLLSPSRMMFWSNSPHSKSS